MARKQFVIPVMVFADSQVEANDINNDINDLLKILKGSELKRFAQAIKKKPGIVSRAIKALNFL